MASIDNRPNKHSKKTWRARVRAKGFRDITRSFDTRQKPGPSEWRHSFLLESTRSLTFQLS